MLLRANGFARDKAKTRVASTRVNLLDLANFAHDVKCPAVFEAVVRHVKITVAGPEREVVVTVDAKHWHCANQVSWADDPQHEIASMIRRLDRRCEASECHLDALVKQ